MLCSKPTVTNWKKNSQECEFTWSCRELFWVAGFKYDYERGWREAESKQRIGGLLGFKFGLFSI